MRRGRLLVVVASLVLGACATRPPVLPEHGATLELTETVFFPQRRYQCGPAALATVLHSSGLATQPDELANRVYLPGRRGSLQIELMAAARREGRIAYVVDPALAALRAELMAGRPVLVLQNLGLEMLPVWHYAVVVGLDPGTDNVILRSGTERRQVMPAHHFLRTWELAGHWGMVVLRPGELPARLDRARYLRAVAHTERHLPSEKRRAVYAEAVTRWPDSTVARFGLAHARHTGGDLHGAESDYRALLLENPRHVAALNNLAEVLNDRGCHGQAREAAEQAMDIARADQPGLVEPVRSTLDKIPAAGDAAGCAAGR